MIDVFRALGRDGQRLLHYANLSVLPAEGRIADKFESGEVMIGEEDNKNEVPPFWIANMGKRCFWRLHCVGACWRVPGVQGQ